MIEHEQVELNAMTALPLDDDTCGGDGAYGDEVRGGDTSHDVHSEAHDDHKEAHDSSHHRPSADDCGCGSPPCASRDDPCAGQ